LKTSDELKLIRGIAQTTAVEVSSALATGLAALDAAIVRVEAEENAEPPPPPPPPPPTAKARLWVDGPTLRTKTGAAVVWRGIESMWGPTSAGNVAKIVGNQKSFGANAISPLFQSGQSSANHIAACIGEARRQGLLVGVNADHTNGGRAWICSPEIVDVCNAADNVILECEVELDDQNGALDWRDNYAIPFVRELRDAGHKSPIKVGSPDGGRSPRYAINHGGAVLATDPLKSLIFTWQAYWHSVPNPNWEYATHANGFSQGGTPGALECADAIRASGLCFLVGLDGRDNVGETPWRALAERLQSHGIGWQWWAWMVGDAYGNGLVSDALSTTPKSPYGTPVRDLLKAQAVLPSL
jgi:hypothetical protein